MLDRGSAFRSQLLGQELGYGKFSNDLIVDRQRDMIGRLIVLAALIVGTFRWPRRMGVVFDLSLWQIDDPVDQDATPGVDTFFERTVAL